MRRGAGIGPAVIVLVALIATSCTTQMPRRGWPEEVVSPVKDGGTLVVQGDEGFGFHGGIEGNQPFVRAMTEAGETVLHLHFGWPGTEERLSAGSYVVNVQTYSCNGNCDNLSPGPMDSCAVSVDIVRDARTVVSVEWDGGSMTCAAAEPA